jgi:hypothetical protein
MPEFGRTWIVLLRDVSHAVRIAGQDTVLASLVLHAETGLILGAFVADTPSEALAGAFDRALTQPAAELPPARPDRVVFPVEIATEVRSAAATLGASELIEAGSVLEAEDIFDGFVGHLAGRDQPHEPPSTEDWALLVGETLAFLRAEPWVRWSDVVPLSLEVTVDASTDGYVAIVMGNAEVQHGLALYPGTALPKYLMSRVPGPDATPDGTLLLFLDPPGEVPLEFARKASRYGWPEDAEFHPAWLVGGPEGARDLGRVDAQRFQVALAAVRALDARGLVLAKGQHATTGQVSLSNGAQASFAIAQLGDAV